MKQQGLSNISRIARFVMTLLVVSILVISILDVRQPTQAASPGAVSQSSGFSFPYTYEQPSVPTGVGAQGSQGPTVPLSSIGVHAQTGSSGHVGPSQIANTASISSSGSRLTVVVRYGALSSYVSAQGASISLTNLTTGKVVKATSNAAGYANLTLTSGWYIMSIPSPSPSYIGFEQQTYVSGSASIVRYLLPSTGSIVSVNNGGSGDAWFSERINVGTNSPPSQLYVSIAESTSPGSPVASGYTMNNGSIEFTNLNTSLSYVFSIDGYSNPYSGVRQFLNNYTTPATSPYSFNGNPQIVITDHSMTGLSTTTGSLSGSQLPTGSNPWSINVATAVNGGITYVSSPLQFSNGATLAFINAVVFFNESWVSVGTTGGITFSNSTIYFLTGGQYLFQTSPFQPNIISIDSTFFANMVRANDSLVLGFTNASNSLFYFVKTNALGALYGTFYNDLILNSSGFGVSIGNNSGNGIHGGHFDPHTNLSYVSIVNSRLTGGNTHIGNLNFTHVLMSNSSTAFSAFRLNAAYFMMNETITSEGANLNAHFWNMTYSELTFTTPKNMTYIQYVNTLPSNNYGNPPGAGPLVTFQMNGAGSGLGLGMINLSYTYLTWGFPMVNISPTFGGFDGFTSFYNCYFNYNDTPAQLNQVIASYSNDVGGIQPSPSSTRPFLGNRINLVFHGPVGMNYSYVDFGDRSFMNPWSHTGINGVNLGWPSYWTHDIFPYKAVMQDTYSFFRFFPSNPAGSVVISNDTFGYIFWNWSADMVGNNQEGFADIWMETATQTVFTPTAYINITYDTFDAPSFSAGPNGMAGNIQFAKSYVQGTVAFCKFLNSPDYVLFPPGVPRDYHSWYLPPHQDNILASSSTVTVHDNYFLNLSNLTMPIGTDQAYQNGGNGGSLTEYNNHFFYYPLPGMSYVNSSWAFSKGGYYGQRVPSYVGIGQAFNGSNIAYEIPMGLGTSMIVKNGGAYVFNTTVGQAAPTSFVTNPQGYGGTPSQYSWALEPNFVWNGTTYVAQYNGMGGPQPNLTYNGYQYQWAFERNMTYISTVSRTASPIPMRWSLPNPNHLGGTVSLYLHNSTSGTNDLLASTSQGVYGTNISYSYKPWVNGATAIFFVNGTDLNFTPPPATNYTVSFTETGLPQATNWSVTLGSFTEYSTTGGISFRQPNGTFQYTVGMVAGWTPSVTSGNVTVNGSNQHIVITFSKVTYKLAFIEQGLAGQTWNVTVGPTSELSAAKEINFNEPNGTYVFSIRSPSDYTSNITAGNVTISGYPVTIKVTFQKNASIQPPGNSTGPTNPTGPNKGQNPILFSLAGVAVHTNELILISAIGVSIAVVAVVVWRMESKRKN